MIKLDINNLELPVLDIVQATPFCIPLKKNKNLYFEVPSVNKYFVFEAKYLKLILKYFLIFAHVNFLELKEFANIEFKKKMLKELDTVMRNIKFRKDFMKIITEYFTAYFKLKKVLDIADPFQLSYIFLFIHNIVENVKKNFVQVAGKMDHQISGIFSIFSRKISTKIEPRF